MRWLFAAMLISVFPVGAWAQSQGLLSFLMRDDPRQWEAVGRLELAGKAFCTGTLVAPELVLTAAHCLYDAAGNPIEPQNIQFLAGWREGRPAAHRRVSRAVTHPMYQHQAQASSSRVYYDLALIELQHPIRNTKVLPIATGKTVENGVALSVISYAHDRSEAPSIQDTCEVIGKENDVLIMSCTVDFGSSGSPVFSTDGGDIEIVSVVSSKAKSGDRPVSLGAPLEGQIATLRALLATDHTVAHAPNAQRADTDRQPSVVSGTAILTRGSD